MLEQHIVIEEHFGLSPFWTMEYATAASYYCMYQGRGEGRPEKEEE
jgi:hypothetical protein